MTNEDPEPPRLVRPYVTGPAPDPLEPAGPVPGAHRPPPQPAAPRRRTAGRPGPAGGPGADERPPAGPGRRRAVVIALTAAVTVIAALVAVAVLTGRDRTDRTGAVPSALPAPQDTGDLSGATPDPSVPGPATPGSSGAAATSGATRTPSRTGPAKRSASTAGTPEAAANPGGTDLALGRPATASSVEGEAYAPRFAVDGDLGTRWSSAFSDPQWISVDLGRLWLVTRVVLRWEVAYGVECDLAVSADGTTWRTVWRTGEGAGGVQDVRIAATPARFVRMTGTRRVTQYGYSLFAFEVR
ncbi:discoidin domain-containing protein [Dactylosporangium siamense]|uniref:F5/8 type C domain-containing protein n=1 Tax=Dactylosporangium siamense TaxID=685454 RepID=A0A919UFX3_9ACTN|nr:discoidin domain-containing protein [Dactylosporangium siamense]GIG50050.1 hypothetical protein Dsi01nite_080910 [Dactylosporangium siamense]